MTGTSKLARLRPLIVLPTYNEAKNIAEVLRRIREAVPAADVLVVDDGSPDGTADLAEDLAGEIGGVKVLRRPAKAGLGSAYREGFAIGLDGDYDLLVEMDADLSHDPAALPQLLDRAARGSGLVIGSRYVPGGSIPRWSLHRRALSLLGNLYAAWALRLPVRDATSGFRAYRADALRAVDLSSVRAEGYGFQIEMVYRVVRAGLCVDEVPIAFSERTHGASKMSKRIVVEALALVTAYALRDLVTRARRPRLRRSPGAPLAGR